MIKTALIVISRRPAILHAITMNGGTSRVCRIRFGSNYIFQIECIYGTR